MRRESLVGRVWVLTDRQGRLMENIDTDQIFHNAHLHITEREKMGAYALGNLDGWEDFPRMAGPRDILAAGRNFGAGSSRQQAVDCFLALKIGAIIAPSFGAIYFRNAVNSALPVLKCPQLPNLVAEGVVAAGDRLKLEWFTGEGEVLNKKAAFRFLPMGDVQAAILRAGGLFAYARTGGGKGKA